MKKRMFSLLTACALLVSTTPAAFAALSDFTAERSYTGQFADVPASAWYYDNVKTAYELGLVNGSSDTTYAPDDNITVAEVQTIVARIHATYHSNTIAPAEGAWYAPYVEYCMEHIDREICSMAYMLDGDVVTADQPASRTYFAYLMYAALPSSEYAQINTIPDGSLPDVDDIVFMDADERIYTLYRAGIVTGNDEYGTFHPDTNITRAEVAAIIARMIDPAQRKTFTLEEKPEAVLNGYEGSYFASLNDPNRPWIGYHLTISSMNNSTIQFDFSYEKPGHAVAFSAENARFTSATTAVASGTTYYADQPDNRNPVTYELTFSNHNIHLNIYINGSTTPDYSIDFACSGTVA
ncbi:S-layer homology domain-containing protein [Candidatus Agathobaculum pullicola]|uniref:S-layer homology domain-containing protein n=1 Tax=Candidatus Agathobaculum pullicola TaxID=2838426 RepID=UPI003F8FF06E